MTDEELIQLYSSGDERGLTQLYFRLKTSIYSYIRNRVGSSDMADDIMQDVWTMLILKADHIANLIEDKNLAFELRPYLYRMAANRVVDFYRQNGRLSELGGDEVLLPSDDAPIEQGVVNGQLMRCLEDCMRPFRMKLQDAFWLTRDGRLTYEQAASSLGVATETVKDWVKQVLVAIRPCREEFEHARS